MASSKKSNEVKPQDDSQLRVLGRILERHGVVIRRENLSRGSSFRVRSGDCMLSGSKHLFVDKRLPVQQQISLLVDYLLDSQCSITADELVRFSTPVQALLARTVAA